MNAKVLFVDDEVNVLFAAKRVFLTDPVDVLTADSGEAALAILREQAVAVIVSDNMMPRMNGIEFLRRSKDIAPDSIRVLMTGHADLRSAIDSINHGGVSRFITKPWDNGELKEAVTDGVARYNVVSAMRNANEATLLSLAQTIELKDPYTKGHCDRVARYALLTAEKLGFTGEEKQHIKQGSWLHDCGKIGVPEGILNFNGTLTVDQFAIIKNHPAWGAEVARLANLTAPVIDIIMHHHERFDGTGYPAGLKGAAIPYLARIVAVADAYDAMSTDRPYRQAMGQSAAITVMAGLSRTQFDPDILDVFIEIIRGDDHGT